MTKDNMASAESGEISRLCQYLPDVLWSANDDRQLLLARFLRIFEKMVIGIDDPERIDSRRHDDYDYLPLEQIIAELPSRFDPWQTKVEPWHKESGKSFLDYLAEWVDLTLDKENWSEYQQRSLLANVSNIYRLQGQKEGLYTYLDMYTKTTGKARIVIDDGVSIVQAAMQGNGMADLYDYAFTQEAYDGTPALVDPVAIDVDIDAGRLVIVDRGRRMGSTPQEQPLRTAIWTIPIARGDPVGSAAAQSNLPVPVLVRDKEHKLDYPDLINPQEVLVDSCDRFYVVDKRLGDAEVTPPEPMSHVYLFTKKPDEEPSEYTQFTIFDSSKLEESKGVVHPVSMVSMTSGSSRFLVLLDRGARLAETAPPLAIPKLVIVKLLKNNEGVDLLASDTDILSVPLPGAVIKEPTALAVEKIVKHETDTEWRLIVADAGRQVADGADPKVGMVSLAPDLIRISIRIDPNIPKLTAGNPKLEAILADSPLKPENPLIFPTDIIVEGQNAVLVCDRGLKYARPVTSQTGDRTMAGQPALYRIRLSEPNEEERRWAISKPERINQGRNLVDPAKMAFDAQEQKLYIADPGVRYLFEQLLHDWRLHPHEFAVLVHFSSVKGLEVIEKQRIVNEIHRIVTEEKPAHSLFWLRNS